MATGHELTPTGYIQHHLTFNAQAGETPFWTWHMDTIFTSVILGVLTFGFLAWVVSGATAGVPTKRQAFVELLIEFVNEQARSIFHGDQRFIAPLALTVFVWVFLMNAMDFLPIDIMAFLYKNVLGLEYWRSVPTADVNTTFALALTVWFLMIFFAIKVKGVGGFIHELFCAPFGAIPSSGLSTSCSTSSSTSPSRSPTACGCTATSTRVKSSSCCSACGRLRVLQGRSLAASSRRDGPYSTS